MNPKQAATLLDILRGDLESFANDEMRSDAALGALVAAHPLGDFRLSLCDITEEGLVHLANLANLTNMKELSLIDTPTTDAVLAHLTNLVDLQELNLSGTRITDEGLAHLTTLTNLRSLDLSGTQITDAGLLHLANLTNLRELDISRRDISVREGGPDTYITDEGLLHLANLTNLRVLRLRDTYITDAGLVHLANLTNLRLLDIRGYIEDMPISKGEIENSKLSSLILISSQVYKIPPSPRKSRHSSLVARFFRNSRFLVCQ